MHLVEQYALACGVKITKPRVETNYFPLPFSDYIVIHPSSGMEAKNYDYYKDVIELLYPYLRNNNIEIVQLGADADPILPHCYAINGKTSLGQSFYLLENSKLLLGNDSFSCHVAGGFNKKIVNLYSNLYKDCCGPYWGDPKRQILLQADRGGKKPSFSNKEEKKVVNNINPEEIARSVLSLLNIKHKLGSYETLHLGSSYHESAVEIVPNFFQPNLFPSQQGLNIRLDYEPNPEITAHWGSQYKVHLILEEPVDTKYFTVFKENIVKISLNVGPSTSPDYIKLLKGLGCQVELFAPDDTDLIPLRVKFLDWTVEKFEDSSKKDLDTSSTICDNTCYKSSKTLLSNGKTYSSKAAWLAKQEKNTTESIIDTQEFWKELQYFRIYNP